MEVNDLLLNEVVVSCLKDDLLNQSPKISIHLRGLGSKKLESRCLRPVVGKRVPGSWERRNMLIATQVCCHARHRHALFPHSAVDTDKAVVRLIQSS